MIPTVKILQGDCVDVMRTLPDESVHCVVTSPPYWGLRDYGVEGQIGLEKTPEEYVAKMVEVFREVRRVLRSDGTCWVNLGDSYAAGGQNARGFEESRHQYTTNSPPPPQGRAPTPPGLKPKDLCGIPWRVAFALQADGWWLRQDIVWEKGNPMPESVRDRCCKSHEYIFLLTKSAQYYFDSEAIKEPASSQDLQQVSTPTGQSVLLQEQPAKGRTSGDLSGLHEGDPQSMGSKIQQNRKGEDSEAALLLFPEGNFGQIVIPKNLPVDPRTKGEVSTGDEEAREGVPLHGETKEIRRDSKRKGNESGQGQTMGQDRERSVCKAKDRDQTQTSNQIIGLHIDASAMEGDQSQIQESVRLLSPGVSTIGKGSCNSISEGRDTHSNEHCSSVPDMQRQERSTRTKRSVWHVNSFATKDAHFATYPPDLIKPCILAGTSARGCCPKCKAPWERMVETSPMEIRKSDRGNRVFGNNHSTMASGTVTKPTETKTIGWQPTCDCGYKNNLYPCTVLDPFGGSGTTGQVAMELGRNAILIELNPSYIQLATKRCHVTPGLNLA